MKIGKIACRLTFYVFAGCLISCSDKSGVDDKTTPGNALYGGVIRINEIETYTTLFPHAITDAVSSSLAFQIYEGLVKFNPEDLSVVPCIASKWELDSSGTLYTFHLKKGVYFHDDLCFQNSKGREVKASDFKYCFDLLCTKGDNNLYFFSTFKDRVEGANEYFENSSTQKSKQGVKGIKVIDDYTLQIKLKTPDNSFLYVLANPYAAVFPKEGVEMYNKGLKVGTGPFQFDEGRSSSEKVVLVRNHSYHRLDSLGNKLPYLDSVVISFLSDKKRELEAFQTDKIDLVIGLPAESVSDIVQNNIQKFKGDSAEYLLDRVPEMITQFYEFNLTKPPFNNLLVRQAFNYAIDRDKIIDEVLYGEAYGPGVNGLIPPAFSGYDIKGIQGYSYNPDKARKLLAQAGYPDGKGFPDVHIELNSGGQKNVNVAIEIQKQLWTDLGVMVDVDIVPFAQKLEDAKYGKSEIFRSGWRADYPSPETFLFLLYGKTVPDEMDKPSFPNTSRYRNATFDKLFEEAKTAGTIKEAYALYQKAEQQMIEDAPVIVLWYDESYRLVKSHVKNFYNNPMRYKYFGEVYIKVRTKAPAEKM